MAVSPHYKAARIQVLYGRYSVPYTVSSLGGTDCSVVPIDKRSNSKKGMLCSTLSMSRSDAEPKDASGRETVRQQQLNCG